MQHLQKLRERGACIVLVSHSLEQVAHFCSRTLAMQLGELSIDDATQPALQQYLALLRKVPGPSRGTPSSDGQPLEQHALFHDAAMRWGDEAARIHSLRLVQNGQTDPPIFWCGQTIHLAFDVDSFFTIPKPVYGVTLKTLEGAIVLNANTLGEPTVPPQKADTTRLVRFSFTPWLEAGDYLLSIGVSSQTDTGVTPHDRCYDLTRLRITLPHLTTGEVDMQPHFDWVDT
jgi:lipopolysaccharide transport system ATP-binding protein